MPIKVRIYQSRGAHPQPVVDEIEVRPAAAEQQIVWELDDELLKMGYRFQEDGKSPPSFELTKAEAHRGNFKPHHLCKPHDRTRLCIEETHLDGDAQEDVYYILRIFIGEEPTEVKPSKSNPGWLPTHSPVIHNR